MNADITMLVGATSHQWAALQEHEAYLEACRVSQALLEDELFAEHVNLARETAILLSSAFPEKWVKCPDGRGAWPRPAKTDCGGRI